MITDKMIGKAWDRLAVAFWRQRNLACDAGKLDLSSAWAQAAIHAAKVGKHSRRKQVGFREFKRI